MDAFANHKTQGVSVFYGIFFSAAYRFEARDKKDLNPHILAITITESSLLPSVKVITTSRARN